MNYIGADLVAEALASLEVKHVFAIVSIPVSYTHLTLPTKRIV